MSHFPADTSRWKRITLIAAGVIICSAFLSLITAPPAESLSIQGPAEFVGSETCKKCHQAAYNKWRGSDHDMAMDVADEKTVLGDFNNVSYTDPYNDVTSRFDRRDGKFFVNTEGPDGKPGDFEIKYTFGFEPLQQYLVPFPGGRLQCLNIAWDVKQKKWYRLPPYEVKGPDDGLHWTRGGQTWNAMCAECHSTRLQKGYNPDTGRYQTTWFEIHVGCEACHGAGSKHVAWAGQPAAARGTTDNYDLEIKTHDISNQQFVTLCAPCHSRRFQLTDNMHTEGDLLDLMVPRLLDEGLYHPDGQILEEVYVYGSFVQSRMYQHGVRCSACHDSHNLKPHREKNALCTHCHQAERFDTPAHHHHPVGDDGAAAGSQCVNCHMPGQIYMGTDYRPDHSLRIPRPELSLELGGPNACSAQVCHADKSLKWTVEHYEKWYGKPRKPHYATTIKAGRERRPEAEGDLIRLAEDTSMPVIVRATALELLQSYPGPASQTTLVKALEEEDSLLRYTAIRSLEHFDVKTLAKRIVPKLYDPVRAVRMEAALMLSALPAEHLREADREAYEKGLHEYRQAMLYNADIAAQRYNLGNLAANQGDALMARAHYEKAIGIDDQFYPAKVNLAMLYNHQGKNREAERLLREVVEQHPDLYETTYSLGLLLAEMHQYEDAEHYLGRAAQGMNYARAYYNHGQILAFLKQTDRSEQAFLHALSLEPENQEFFFALADLYLKTDQREKARDLALDIAGKIPDHKAALDLLRYLKK